MPGAGRTSAGGLGAPVWSAQTPPTRGPKPRCEIDSGALDEGVRARPKELQRSPGSRVQRRLTRGVSPAASRPRVDQRRRRRRELVPRLQSPISQGESRGLSPSKRSLPYGRRWMPLPATVYQPTITPTRTTAQPITISMNSAYTPVTGVEMGARHIEASLRQQPQTLCELNRLRAIARVQLAVQRAGVLLDRVRA
jgi:hypothetical protein